MQWHRQDRLSPQLGTPCWPLAQATSRPAGQAAWFPGSRHNSQQTCPPSAVTQTRDDRALTIIVSDIASRQHCTNASSMMYSYVKGYVLASSTGGDCTQTARHHAPTLLGATVTSARSGVSSRLPSSSAPPRSARVTAVESRWPADMIISLSGHLAAAGAPTAEAELN